MSFISILPAFLGWLKSRMLKNYDLIIKDQMASLGCLLVCTFGSLLAPVLVLVHTINNLELGDEQGHKNEGYESD